MYSFTSVNYRISGIIPRSEEQHVGFGKLTLELWNFFLEIYFFFFFGKDWNTFILSFEVEIQFW